MNEKNKLLDNYLVDFLKGLGKEAREGGGGGRRGQVVLDFGKVDSEVNTALGAIEAIKAMRDVEDGLASGARELDLGRIDALGLRRGATWGSASHHKLRREHLGELALGATKLHHPRCHSEDRVAPRASDLATSRGRRWRRDGKRRSAGGLAHNGGVLELGEGERRRRRRRRAGQRGGGRCPMWFFSASGCVTSSPALCSRGPCFALLQWDEEVVLVFLGWGWGWGCAQRTNDTSYNRFKSLHKKFYLLGRHLLRVTCFICLCNSSIIRIFTLKCYYYTIN